MITFRIAKAPDSRAITDLVESGYRGDRSRVGWTTEADLLDGQRTDVEEVAGIIGSPANLILIAEADDELVCCCHLSTKSPDTAYFGMFVVQPTKQGGGLGRQMVAEAERIMFSDHRCMRMEMQVIEQRTELIAWYERQGYLRTGETRPFPYGDERFGIPKRDDLVFVVLEKKFSRP